MKGNICPLPNPIISWPNDLENINQGQKSLHATQPHVPWGKSNFTPAHTHTHKRITRTHTHTHTHTHTLSISLSHGVQHHLTLSFSPHTTSMLCHHNLVCDHPRQLTCSLWFVGRSLTRCHHHQYHLPVPQWGFPSQQASLLKNNVKLWTTVFWYQMLHRWVNARKT